MIDEQGQYKKEMSRINKMRIPKTIKIEMLNSFKEILKQSILIKKITAKATKSHFNTAATQNKLVKRFYQNQSTKFSLSESMSLDTMIVTNQRDIEELQENILHKKIFKIQNYQQIELLEQELYRVQDLVQSKRKYNDHLRKRIDQKMIDIQLQKEIQQQKQKTKKKSVFDTPQRSKSERKQNSKSLNKSFSDYLKSFWW